MISIWGMVGKGGIFQKGSQEVMGWGWWRYLCQARVHKEGLCDWVKMVKRKKDGIKRDLMNKLGEILEKEWDNDNLEELIDMKIQLNLEIDKDEMFWEQRARAN